jgi:hypothetical protein
MKWIFMVSAILLFAILYPELRKWPCPREEKKVARVGGCDKNGYCGVVFEDGSYDFVLRPVVGITISMCKENK